MAPRFTSVLGIPPLIKNKINGDWSLSLNGIYNLSLPFYKSQVSSPSLLKITAKVRSKDDFVVSAKNKHDKIFSNHYDVQSPRSTLTSSFSPGGQVNQISCFGSTALPNSSCLASNPISSDSAWLLSQPKMPSLSSRSVLATFFSCRIFRNLTFPPGSATLLCVFIVFLFTIFSLGALINTEIFLQADYHRRGKWLLQLASENGVKWGLSSLRRYFEEKPPFVFLEEDMVSYASLAPIKLPPENLEEIIGTIPIPPDPRSEYLYSWTTSLTPSHLDSFTSNGTYWLADYQLKIRGLGKSSVTYGLTFSELTLRLKVGAGHLPLAWFPFLLEGIPTPEEKQSIDLRIKTKSGEANILSPRKVILESSTIISSEPLSWLKKNLKIGTLEAGDLTHRRFREILGLNPSDEPIPEGVYLLRDDLGLGGLFIQGDVDEILLGIEESFQIILVRRNEKKWLLRFSPIEQKTEFQTPLKTEKFNLIPRGMIIINGGVKSLSAAVVSPQGELFPTTEKIPCFLQGITLTFLCSQEITITSHLFQQGLRLEEKIPYIKGQEAQLIIWSSGKNILTGEKQNGGIKIQIPEQEGPIIQAHLTSSSFESSSQTSGSKKLQLLGSLQTKELKLTNSSLVIYHQPPLQEEDDLYQPFPTTERPILAIIGISPSSWSEYVNN